MDAAQIRRVVIGDTDREPTPAELQQMRDHAPEAMRAGATGVSTALNHAVGALDEENERVAPGGEAAAGTGVDGNDAVIQRVGPDGGYFECRGRDGEK